MLALSECGDQRTAKWGYLWDGQAVDSRSGCPSVRLLQIPNAR